MFIYIYYYNNSYLSMIYFILFNKSILKYYKFINLYEKTLSE